MNRFSGQSTLLPEKPCTHLWAFGAKECDQGPMKRETESRLTNTTPALVGCGGEMAPCSAGPHPPVRTACSSHCGSHLTDRTSFSTKHREGPATVVTHNIRYGGQNCHSYLSTRAPEGVTLLCSQAQLVTETIRAEVRGHSLVRPWPPVSTEVGLAGQVAPSSESN